MNAPISIIIPTLNEARTIAATLAALQSMRARGAEIIVVDGGSNDGTASICARHADRTLQSPRGRALQMNTGAHAATGEVLLFLHADSLPPEDADLLILKARTSSKQVWGRFDVNITGANPMFRLIAGMMNLRSRLSGIATGDQGIFITRSAFDAAGGFPNIPLMEDIALSKTLKRVSSPICLSSRITTSGRRWEKYGVLPTIVLMWRLRAAYFFGADPAQLAARYYGQRK
jgi:rSAM/selenodomain-associated transferase 2